MTGADKKIAKVKARINGAGVDAALLGVIVELPFQVAIAGSSYAEARNHWREAPRLSKEGDPGEIGCGGEDIARAVDDCATKVRVGEVLHLYFPGDELVRASGHAWAHRRICRRRTRARLVIAPCMLALEKKPVEQPKFNFVGIA